MVEASTSLESVFIAKLGKKTEITSGGVVLKPWTTTKKDDRVVQTRLNGAFIVSDPARIAVYLHLKATTTQAGVTCELYSATKGIVVDTATVKVIAGEQLSVLLNHRVTKSETLTVRVLGDDLNLTVAANSRVEVTLLRQWYPPELIVSGDAYPWGSGTYKLVNDIEAYRHVHITGQNGDMFIGKSISPLGMRHDSINKVWKIDIEDKILLEFKEHGHKTMIVKVIGHGYKILSIYGER